MGRFNRQDHPDFFEDHRIVASMQGRRGRRKLHTFASKESSCMDLADHCLEPVPAIQSAPWRWVGRGMLHEMSVASLASGVDVPASTLIVILDALRHFGRHRVDLDDIKLVVSQLGSQISHVHKLPTEPPRDGIYTTHPDGRMERMTRASSGGLEPTGEVVVTRRGAVDALYVAICARCTTL